MVDVHDDEVAPRPREQMHERDRIGPAAARDPDLLVGKNTECPEGHAQMLL
jgi:hypothetical protein